MNQAQQALLKVLWQPIREYVAKAMCEFLRTTEGIGYITALGTVSADYVSGLPQVRFDRDSYASGMTYPYVAAYVPAANDRVVLLRVGNGWLILGKVVNA